MYTVGLQMFLNIIMLLSNRGWQTGPANDKCVACKHVFILYGLWPKTGKTVACIDVNLARYT